MKTHHKLQLYTAIMLSALMMSCGTQKIVQQPNTSLSKELKEISPGILQGYLSKEDIPNSLALAPPPPEEGSAAFLLDQEVAATYEAMQDEARKDQATQDAVLAFPEAVNAFNSVLDVQISDANIPDLYMILRRTLADAGLSTYAAKNHYQRARPFMVNKPPIFTPEDEAALRKDGSYPSGYTAIGWALDLTLRLAPKIVVTTYT